MSFYEWMMMQIGRNDEVGNLARDIKFCISLGGEQTIIDMAPEYWQAKIKSKTTDSRVLMALYGAIAEYRETFKVQSG